MKVIAVADSDSYLKWSLATLNRLPAQWTSTQLVIDSPVRPSARQLRAAGDDRAEVLTYRKVIERISSENPDVVLFACTGPVVATLAGSKLFRRTDRPVLVTGLPGISIPATAQAVAAREGCDLLVLHSHRERMAFASLVLDQRLDLQLGLARLPFLSTERPSVEKGRGTTIVFAAQAQVPPERSQREQILRALAAAPNPVVKLRAGDGEQQTHHERWPYPMLMNDLVRTGELAAGAVTFVEGSMDDALQTAAGLATVSSTAALEAMARGLPSLVISDFGVSTEMINLVFADSDCIGTLDDLSHGRLRHPDPAWLDANYFHQPAADDWLARLDELVAIKAARGLPTPRVSAPWRRRLRRRIRLLPGFRSLRARSGRGRRARVRPRHRLPG